jgi:hypothetical protein
MLIVGWGYGRRTSIDSGASSALMSSTVRPDIAVSSEEAFTVAYREALGHVLADGDVPPPLRHEAEDALAGAARRPLDLTGA